MTLKVRVIPNARRTELGGYRDDELVLRLTARAIEGRANNAAIDYIAQCLGVSRSSVALVSGERSRHKKFEIVGFSRELLEQKLAALKP
jgi:uncharacterized protein (TIGR00251 family)